MYRRTALILLFAVGLVTTGCGDGSIPVRGAVKLDGNPVEGASVTFVSEDGQTAYVGVSDASGQFDLANGDRKGIPPGSYKIVVFKSHKVEGTEGVEAGGADYMKMMEKEGKFAKEKLRGGAGTTPMPGMTPMPGRKMTKSATEAQSGVKTELPAIYASASSTPLTVKIPNDNQPVSIDLKSKQ